MKRLYTYVNPKTGENASLLSKEVYGVINKNAALLDSSIIYDRDFSYDYFGFKTLEKSYLLKLDGKVIERPQHMLMRVAVGIHMDDIDSVLKHIICFLKNGLLTQHLLYLMLELQNHNFLPCFFVDYERR